MDDDWSQSPVKRSYSHYDDDADRDDRDRDDRDSSRHKRRRGSDPDHRPPPSSAPSDIEYRILCPVAKIGAVIGKGGSIIKSLRQQVRAKIKVEDAIHGAEERVIYISSPAGRSSARSSSPTPDRDRDSSDREMRDVRRERERDRDNEMDDMLCPAQEALFRIHSCITERDHDSGHGSDGEDEDEKHTQVTARLLVSAAQVGCIIGKGGRIIEQMRKDIAAQIRVLPRSSLPPCAFPNDELVQLSGTPSLVKKALYAVSSKLFENPTREKERPSRTVGMSHGSSYPGGGMYSNVHGPGSMLGMGHYGRPATGSAFPVRNSRSDMPEEELMVCVLCPNEKIGSMIGKGGSIVRKLREDSGAKIRVCDQVGNSDERVIQISAIEYVDSLASPVVDAVMQVYRRLADISAEREGRNAILSIRLLVRSNQIGCLLGKGGQIITDMRKSSRANIRIPPKNELPACADQGSELVQLSGEAAMVENALLQVLSRLHSNLFKGRDLSHGNPGMMHLPYQGTASVLSAYGGRDELGSPGGYNYEYRNYSTSPSTTRSSRRRHR